LGLTVISSDPKKLLAQAIMQKNTKYLSPAIELAGEKYFGGSATLHELDQKILV
jgi:hypothetical protein